MKDELVINGKDAYTTWGISMDSTSLSALMTPPANKAYLENESRIEHGKRVTVTNPMVNARDLTLQLHLTADTEEQFFHRYRSFCDQLTTGRLDIATMYQPGVVYKTIYLSCSQFTQFMRGIGKFSLKINEPDPTDRKETA